MTRGPKEDFIPANKLEQRIAALLLGRVRPAATEILELIRQINPTGRELSAAETRRRYQLKSQLQSLLVCRFGKDLEIVPEPHQAGVVRLRHRYLDRGDAAHAVVAELEADARALVQRYLDTLMPVEEAASQPAGTGAALRPERWPAPPEPEPAPGDADDAPWPELVRRGQAAVTDYDYEGGRAILEAAVARSGGALEAARPLLSLLVEVLAAYGEALALAPELSTEATADPALRALLAQATVHSQPSESVQAEVERWLRGVAPADAAAVWIVLAERALRAGEEPMAVAGLEQARELGASPSELLRLDAELQALRRSWWREAEAALEQALSQGSLAGAEPKARELLEKWPESPAARRVLALLHEQRRHDERERLVADAETALQRGDFERAAERSHAARALAGDTADLDSRIERARTEAQRQRDREQVDRVTTQLAAGASEDRALLLYLQLPPRLRSEARQLAGLPQLDWLEQAGAPSTGARAQAAVEAVQALARCAGSAGPADPAAVLSTLAPYEAVLERVGRFRELVASAHAARAAHRHQQALEQLEEARAALQSGEVERAGSLLQATDQHALASKEREQARALDEQIRRRAEGRRRAAEVRRRLAVEDLLGALEESDALLALCEEDQADAVARREEIVARLQRAYCVRELHLDAEGDPLPGRTDLGVLGGVIARMARQLPISTAVRGDEATVATSYGPWLFLWTVALDVPRLRRVVRLRTPAPLGGEIRVVAASDRLWILGNMHVLALDPAGAKIRFWRPLADFLGPEGFVDDAFVLPEAGYLWLRPALEATSRAVVIDLRRWRLRREVPLGPCFKPVLGGWEPLLASYGLSHEVRLFAADGSTRDRLTYPEGKVEDVSLPGGAGPLLGLCVERDEEDEIGLPAPTDPEAPPEKPFVAMGLAEPGSAAWSVPLSSPRADGPHLLTAAREHDLTIVAYQREEGPLRLYGLIRRGHELKRRWKAESLGGLLCLQDPARRRAFALFATIAGWGLTELGPAAPERLSQSTDYEHRLPRLSGPFFCDKVGLELPSPVLQQLERLPFTPRAEVSGFLAALRLQHADDPSTLLAMTDFTPGPQRTEHAEFIRARFPEHPLLPMRLADAASQRDAWEEAAAALRHVEIDLLPERGRRHALHLLGIVRLRSGDLDGAEQAWRQAAQCPGPCTIDRCLAWLSALRQPPDPTEQTADPSCYGVLVRLLRTVDTILEQGVPELAIRALEQPMIWALEERQTLARLTAAYLRLSPGGGLPLFHKTLALARFCAWHEEPFLTDNLCLLSATWDDQHLGALYQAAAAWLAALSAEDLPSTLERTAATRPGGSEAGSPEDEPPSHRMQRAAR